MPLKIFTPPSMAPTNTPPCTRARMASVASARTTMSATAVMRPAQTYRNIGPHCHDHLIRYAYCIRGTAGMVATTLADWHEGRSAVRMLAAALGAYLATNVIHLPGGYSAVITTLVVARPHSGGVLRASFE